MKLYEATRIDGGDICLMAEKVISVHPDTYTNGKIATPCALVIMVNGDHFRITETYEQVIEELREL